MITIFSHKLIIWILDQIVFLFPKMFVFLEFDGDETNHLFA
jgi:hypothetical protein